MTTKDANKKVDAFFIHIYSNRPEIVYEEDFLVQMADAVAKVTDELVDKAKALGIGIRIETKTSSQEFSSTMES